MSLDGPAHKNPGDCIARGAHPFMFNCLSMTRTALWISKLRTVQGQDLVLEQFELLQNVKHRCEDTTHARH